MNFLSKLPNEVLQQIGSLLDLREKYTFLCTSTEAQRAFYKNDQELKHIWNIIFQNTSWLNRVYQEEGVPALVGYDLTRMGGTESRNLTLALVLPASNGDLVEINDEHELLKTLKSQNFDNSSGQILFENLTLNITGLLDHKVSGQDIDLILHPDKNLTYVTYFEKGEPTALKMIPVHVIQDSSGKMAFRVTDQGSNRCLGYFEKDSFWNTLRELRISLRK